MMHINTGSLFTYACPHFRRILTWGVWRWWIRLEPLGWRLRQILVGIHPADSRVERGQQIGHRSVIEIHTYKMHVLQYSAYRWKPEFNLTTSETSMLNILWRLLNILRCLLNILRCLLNKLRCLLWPGSCIEYCLFAEESLPFSPRALHLSICNLFHTSMQGKTHLIVAVVLFNRHQLAGAGMSCMNRYNTSIRCKLNIREPFLPLLRTLLFQHLENKKSLRLNCISIFNVLSRTC